MFIGTRNSMVSGASCIVNDMNMKIESTHTQNTIQCCLNKTQNNNNDTQVDCLLTLKICFCYVLLCSWFTLPYSNANAQQKVKQKSLIRRSEMYMCACRAIVYKTT